MIFHFFYCGLVHAGYQSTFVSHRRYHSNERGFSTAAGKGYKFEDEIANLVDKEQLWNDKRDVCFKAQLFGSRRNSDDCQNYVLIYYQERVIMSRILKIVMWYWGTQIWFDG